MSDVWQQTIRQLHASRYRVLLAVTALDADAITELTTSGADRSRTVLEAVVIPDAQRLVDWLGVKPERFCSPETALAMAVSAYRRATKLCGAEIGDLVGLGCVTSLLSPRRPNEHRCFVAAQTADATGLQAVIDQRSPHTKPDEDRLVGRLVLKALEKACRLDALAGDDVFADVKVSFEEEHADPLLVDLWCDRRRIVWSLPDGLFKRRAPEEMQGILSGSFNPLHEGHTALRDAAEKWLKGPVGYELSIENADKPPLDYLTIGDRRRQFPKHPLALTSAPTFIQKAELLPGTTFVVGADTADRIVQPRFYEGRDDLMRQSLEKIRDAGCRFLVAGRHWGADFLRIGDIPIPDGYRNLFEELPETEFRMDITSTRHRQTHRESEKL